MSVIPAAGAALRGIRGAGAAAKAARGGKKGDSFMRQLMEFFTDPVKNPSNPTKMGRFLSRRGAQAGTAAFGVSLAPEFAQLPEAFGSQFDPGSVKTAAGEFFADENMFKLLKDKADRTRQAITENAKVLAQVNPALFSELLAGRRLPRGAMVIGGEPRGDLVAAVAKMMSEGAKPQQGQQPMQGAM